MCIHCKGREAELYQKTVTNGIATVFSNPDQLCLDIPVSLPKLSLPKLFMIHTTRRLGRVRYYVTGCLQLLDFGAPISSYLGFSELLVKFILQCSQIL